MKHHALDHLQTVAEVDQDYPRQIMSRNERLERWVELLERNPDRRLSTLHQTEYQPARERAAMRSDGSPISVAFDGSSPPRGRVGKRQLRRSEAVLRTDRSPITQGHLLLPFRRDLERRDGRPSHP